MCPLSLYFSVFNLDILMWESAKKEEADEGKSNEMMTIISRFLLWKVKYETQIVIITNYYFSSGIIRWVPCRSIVSIPFEFHLLALYFSYGMRFCQHNKRFLFFFVLQSWLWRQNFIKTQHDELYMLSMSKNILKWKTYFTKYQIWTKTFTS